MAALCALPVPASAQTDLRADLNATFQAVTTAENLLETLNCTALYRSLSLLLGEGSEMAATFQEREGYMASLSGMLWVAEEANAGQTPEQVFATLLPPINTATEQYLAYMDQLSATTDAPFDDVVIGTVEFCNGIYGSLQEEAE